jgi:hypothetical protein
MSDQLVTVESYQFLPEAEAVRMHLESEGLSAHLADAEAVSTEWVLANAIGNIKLRVPESQAEAALAMLKELRSRRLERSQSPESDAIGCCLSCGASLHSDQSKCGQCGWSYTDDEEESSETAAGHEVSVLENLRAIRRPLMLIVLLPTLLGSAFLAIVILGWVIQSVTGLPIF